MRNCGGMDASRCRTGEMQSDWNGTGFYVVAGSQSPFELSDVQLVINAFSRFCLSLMRASEWETAHNPEIRNPIP